jgi:glycosidase
VDVSVAGARLSVRFRVAEEQVEGARLLAGLDTIPMFPQLDVDGTEVWRGSLDRGTVEYRIEVESADGISSFGPYPPPSTPFEAVAWVGEGVAYQIFPERFWNGDPSNDSVALATDEHLYWDPELGSSPPTLTAWDGPADERDLCCHQYFGGDLQGIVDRLGHLEELGVTAVYLNPIFAAGSAHGYDTWNYLEVAPNFGDSLVLRTLVDQAHARGIRLIWDFVPNHVGVGHWAFQDAVTRGEDSDYWSWFTFHVPAERIQVGNGEHYAAWWGYGSLPELRTTNPAVLEHLVGVAQHWTAFGFDGIRVDVPNELDNRTEFFPAWRAAVKALNPEVYLLGEIWERDPSWVQGDQFDALMNYAVGREIVEPFVRGETSGAVAGLEMAGQIAAYPEATTAMAFNLVSSHDTDRLLVEVGGWEAGDAPGPEILARYRLTSAVLFALPGMPVTFQGDECGAMGGSRDRLATRYPIQWEACDPESVGHYARLAELKRTVPALGSPVFRSYAEATPVLAFLRGEPGPGEVLAVFNNATSAAVVPLPEGTWTDLVSGEDFADSASVDGLGWRYLRRQ